MKQHFINFVAEAAIIEAEWLLQQEDTDQHFKPGWRFFQILKAHPDLASPMPTVALRRIEEAVAAIQRWPDWDDWYYSTGFAEDRDHFRGRFFAVWESIKFPAQGSALLRAFDLAQLRPTLPGGNDDTAKFRLLLGIAKELQAIRGSEPIILPQVELGKLLDLTQARVSQLIKLALGLGYLEPKSKGSKTSKLASTYFYKEPGG